MSDNHSPIDLNTIINPPNRLQDDRMKKDDDWLEDISHAVGVFVKRWSKRSFYIAVAAFVGWASIKVDRDYFNKPSYKPEDFVSEGGLDLKQAKTLLQHINQCKASNGMPDFCKQSFGDFLGNPTFKVETAQRNYRNYLPSSVEQTGSAG